jgi:hypothetical protein
LVTDPLTPELCTESDYAPHDAVGLIGCCGASLY